MLAAMASEEVLSDPDLRQRAVDALAHLQARVAERLSQDRQAEVLPAEFDPATIASVITTYLQGTWRMALVEYDRPRFERQINAFLTGLGL
jgi:TetR/AcrR family transcriptional repressor of nem operon